MPITTEPITQPAPMTETTKEILRKWVDDNRMFAGPWGAGGGAIHVPSHDAYTGVEADGSLNLAELATLIQNAERERWDAAATDLLKALKEFMDIWGSRDSNGDSKRAQKRRAALWDMATQAVAKAEGREVATEVLSA